MATTMRADEIRDRIRDLQLEIQQLRLLERAAEIEELRVNKSGARQQGDTQGDDTDE